MFFFFFSHVQSIQFILFPDSKPSIYAIRFFLEKNFFVAKGQKKLVYLEWKNVQ